MLVIKLLGNPRIEGQTGAVAGRGTQRGRMALLAVLAISRDRALSRERITSLLWPDRDAENARHLLRNTLYRLREALGDEALPGAGDDLRLDPAHVRCDVWEFEDAVSAGGFGEADRLYEGPFLDGFVLDDSAEFEHWVDAQAFRLATMHRQAVEGIAAERSSAGDSAGAIAARRRLVALDPHDSGAALQLMEALEAAGDRAGALKHAALHNALLATDLGAAPDPDVIAYAERLRSQPTPRLPNGASHRGAAPSTAHVGASDTRPMPTRTRTPVRAKRIAFVGLGAVFAAALAVFMSLKREAAATDSPSITVLPAQNPVGDSAADYIAAGMADDIAAILFKAPNVSVTFSRSALTTGSRRAPLDIARELTVANLLTIAVRREGDQLKVGAFLVRTKDATLVWSERYERVVNDAFLVQDQIAEGIASALRIRLAHPATSAEFGTENSDAYLAFLQARYHLERRGTDNLLLARDYYRRSIANDDKFARAHAGLSATATLLTLYDSKRFGGDTLLSFALAEADRALALDPRLGDAHAARGQALAYLGRRREAERSYRSAVSFDPHSADAHQWFAELLIAEGRVEEAMSEVELATLADPLAAIDFGAACNLFRLGGKFEKALRFGERGIELNPAMPAIWEFYARTLFDAGLRDSAEHVLAHEQSHHPMYAYIRAKNGNAAALDSARHVARLWREIRAGVDGTVPPIGVISLAAGDGSAALDALEYSARSPAFPLHDPLIDPIYDPIRDSARFREIVRRAALDETLNLHPKRARK